MADQGAAAAEAALSLPFGDAKERHTALLQRALRDGPPEQMFREHWAPGAEFHASLRSLLARAAVALAAEAPAAAPAAAPRAGPSSQVTLTRRSDGDFWGFLIGKALRVLQVDAGSPAEAAGLRKGVTVLQCDSSPCTKPSDAYGEQKNLTLTLTVTDAVGPAAPVKPKVEKNESDDDMSAEGDEGDKPKKKKEEKPWVLEMRPGDWLCPREGCDFHNFAERGTCKKCGARAPMPGQKPAETFTDGWGIGAPAPATSGEWRVQNAYVGDRAVQKPPAARNPWVADRRWGRDRMDRPQYGSDRVDPGLRIEKVVPAVGYEHVARQQQPAAKDRERDRDRDRDRQRGEKLKWSADD